ncbi:glycosyltransferase family 2 protein [Lysinibacillus fusiformis]|uniref:glycosyltransferase family 2 protein n=1 Tax=Lysinibacillus fusiformis TaxID=28031 RepID=UPI0035C1D307|nr:glycosyltransferase family 2 protein [Lysinibacillus fusiformis]
MNNGPKISIITACFNTENTIEQTIKSVLEQTYKNIEYIIIDGASTDGTMEIVGKYMDKIDVVVSGSDKGVYDAFNKGVQIASGEYVMFLNADDYLLENDVIKQLADFIIKKNEAVCVYGDIYMINESTGYKTKYGQNINLEKLKEGIMPPHPATLLLREVLLALGGFDLQYRIAADFDLMAKVLQKYENRMYYLPIVVSMFRLGGLSSNDRTRSIVLNETKSILNKYFPDNRSLVNQQAHDTNESLMKKWLEQIIFHNKSISTPLKEKQIKSVVIFGSEEMALLIARDLINSDIQIRGYLDNNELRHGIIMNDIEVYHPEWLWDIENIKQIDAVIFGFQGFHDEAVKKQLDTYKLKKEIQCLSWRDLVCDIN